MKTVIPVVCLTILMLVPVGGTAGAADEEFAAMERQLQLILEDQAIDLASFPAEALLPPMLEVEDPEATTLSQLLSLLTWFAQYEGGEEREAAARALGQLALYYWRSPDLQIDIITGMHPDDVIENTLEAGLQRLGIEPAVGDLFDAYVISGRPRIRALIQQYDPSLLDGLADEPPDDGAAIEPQADPAEAARIVERWNDPDLSIFELNETMKRLGEIGGRENASALIARLSAPRVPSAVKQTGIRALGKLGGSDAQAFLREQLRNPMPPGAQIDDYGATEAILRSQAALALGRCGDESAIPLCLALAADATQYARVREACRKAMEMLRQRFAPEEGTGR